MDRSALSVAILRQRLGKLLEAVPAAQAGDETSVHQARVASRRLREALPVVGASAGPDAVARARRSVARITRALGPVRELDVSLKLLAEFGSHPAASRRAVARVRAAIVAERQARRRRMLAVITPGQLERLRRQLTRVTGHPLVAVTHPRRDGRHSSHRPRGGGRVAEAARQAAVRAARLRAAIEQAGDSYSAPLLHQVRIATKKLRYALEVQKELTRSRSTWRLDRLKKQQDLLGRMHDLEVLIRRTRFVQRLARADRAGPRAAGARGLAALVRALEAQCRVGHAAYLRGRASLLRLCEGVILDARAGRPRAA
jgi:CHAD domain-containing protein